MKRRVFSFSLRPKRDKDIIEALEEIEEGDFSNVIRQGLRLVLGSKQKNVIQPEKTKEAPPKKLEWNFPKQP